MDIKIRPATPADIDWLLGELRQFSKFYGTKKSLFGDEEYVRSSLVKVMENHLLLIAEKPAIAWHGSYPMGFVSGILVPHIFNPAIKVFYETFWWVTTEHRGTKAASLMLDAFIEWGKKNADWIFFYLTDLTEVNGRALIGRGFYPKETSYLMEVA